jgi:adenylyl-sulfate kinase
MLAMGYRVEVLDGDEMRRHLCQDLGFSKEDRNENVRRIARIAERLNREGITVIVAAISPYREARDEARGRIRTFLEIYVHASLQVCETRDIKGLYREARAGKLLGFTGIDDPYEPPVSPEVVCHTEVETIEESSSKILAAALATRGCGERTG